MYSMITNTGRLVDIFKAAKGIWMPPILINFNGNCFANPTTNDHLGGEH